VPTSRRTHSSKISIRNCPNRSGRTDRSVVWYKTRHAASVRFWPYNSVAQWGPVCHWAESTREILRKTGLPTDKPITAWSRGRKYLHTSDEASELYADGRRRKNFRFIASIMRNAVQFTHTPANWTPGGNPDPISDHMASMVPENFYRMRAPKPNLRRQTTGDLSAVQAQSHLGSLSGFA
jgi:hypothetical protein